MSEYCCETMTQWSQPCKTHEDDPLDCPDYLIHRTKNGKLTGIRIFDGGSSFVVMAFCPWCGEKLLGHEFSTKRMIEV